MESYLNLVQTILDAGIRTPTRTGVDAFTVSGMMFQHDMSKGFPLLTTKRVPFRLVASELEFFLSGKTDKRWLQEHGNHIWDEWCSPEKVPYGHDLESKQRMKEERDLGPVYGFQWRHFGAPYRGYNHDYAGEGIDQLSRLVTTLKTNPRDRRMLVSAWNPLDLGKMALPACHYGFQVTAAGGKLNLLWNQRSVDTMLGLPFNIASYGLLLHLLAKETGHVEGTLTGFLADVHIYENHVPAARVQLERSPRSLPRIETSSYTSLFAWSHLDSRVVEYDPHPPIKMEVAV
ncbi:thymidylate synthase [Candidatus Woesearchaeota archaeon]|nr:thymidylate synthase [Candidatus Woesearchaeota archaeon]